MLPKGFDEVGPDDRHVVRTEVVGEEVHEPGEEVSGQVSEDSQDRHKPQIAELDRPLEEIHAYTQGEQGETQNAEDFQEVMASAGLGTELVLRSLVLLGHT